MCGLDVGDSDSDSCKASLQLQFSEAAGGLRRKIIKARAASGLVDVNGQSRYMFAQFYVKTTLDMLLVALQKAKLAARWLFVRDLSSA